jgi:predicted MFS family arabinose efflux permease
MGQVTGLLSLTVGFFLLRAIGQGALSLSALHVVNLWFVRRRGLAVGLMGVGMALAVTVVPALIEQGLSAFGWRQTYVLVGVAVVVLVVPVAALFFRHRPERYGLVPDGREADLGALPTSPEPEVTLAEARRTRAFWLLCASLMTMNCLGTAYLFHHVDLMASGGIGRADAAVMFVAYGVVNGIANLGAGVLLDRWGPRRVLAAGMGLFALLTAGLPLVSAVSAVALYGVAFGIAQGIQSNVGGSAFAYFFGRAHIGAIKGFTRTLFVASTAVGPPLLAWAARVAGGYAGALWVLALVPAGLTVAVAVGMRRS